MVDRTARQTIRRLPGEFGRGRTVRFAVTLLVAWLAATGVWAAGSISGTVADADGNPVEGAVVRVANSQERTSTAADGSYSLELLPGSYRLFVIAQGYGTKESSAIVAEGSDTAVDFQVEHTISQFGERVVVIGSRSERTALETAVPVDVLTSEDIEESSQAETSRMIQFLAPSFNVSTSTISDGTDLVRPSTLRGLGPDQTLVLVNGKRRHNSALIHVNGSIGRGTAGIDLNAIPSSAIDNVEVLRDGASAQYGSDAIAGVINVGLNRSVGITRVELNAGKHYAGDGELFLTSINRGWKIGEDGFINATFEFRDRGHTNRAGRDPRRIFNFTEQVFGQPALVDSDDDDICDGTLIDPCTDDPRELTYDRLNHRYGDGESENYHLFLNSEVPLANDWKFYFFGGASERDGESAGFNRLPSQNRTSILVHPEGHLPLINTAVDDQSLSAGVIKVFKRWSIDTSLTTGKNEFNFAISNSANTSMGLASPTSTDAGTLSFRQTALNVDCFVSTQSGTSIAFGVEARQDSYSIQAGDLPSYFDGGVPDQFGGLAPAGIQVFPGFQPSNKVDEDRENIAVYGEVEFEFADRVLLALAARGEDYSDFGSNVSGKVAARFEIVKQFALRGSASTGFRAPSLHQSNFNNISTQFVDVGGVLTPLEVGTFRVSDPVAQALGATDLEEETSASFSVGFTTRPLPNLSITGDVYQIEIDDRIVLSGRFSASNPQVAPLLPVGINAAQFFTNAIDTTTEGADLVIAWSHPLGGNGTISLTGAGSWNKTELDGPVRTPPPLAGLGETLFDDIEKTYLERAQPREAYNIGARYGNGPWGVMLRVNKFGAVQSTESASDPARKQTFTGKWIVDLDLSRNFGEHVKIAIGANNLLDEFPDRNIASNAFNGIFIYPRRTAPFGFNGGYYYARATLTF